MSSDSMPMGSFDEDLNPVIEAASSEELQFLVDLILDKTSNMLSIDEDYKRYNPDHCKYAKRIADEIRLFGGNTFANTYRGEGPSYAEIVRDVALKFDLKIDPSMKIRDAENEIVLKVLKEALNHMTDKEKEELLKELGASSGDDILSAHNVYDTLFLVFKAGGFMSYRILLIVVNAIAKMILGHGLRLATNCAITRIAGILAGPVGWAITGLWTLVDLAGPSFKVTIPTVIYVATLRKKHELSQDPELVHKV